MGILGTILAVLMISSDATAYYHSRCEQFFSENQYITTEDIKNVLPEKALTIQLEDTFFYNNREKLVNHYIRFPTEKSHHVFWGLLTSEEEILDIVTKGIGPLFELNGHDFNQEIKEAALKSLYMASTETQGFSIIVEVNQLKCTGCFIRMRDGMMRVDRRVPLNAIENIYILTGGIRPAYVPIDLSAFRARP